MSTLFNTNCSVNKNAQQSAYSVVLFDDLDRE